MTDEKERRLRDFNAATENVDIAKKKVDEVGVLDLSGLSAACSRLETTRMPVVDAFVKVEPHVTSAAEKNLILNSSINAGEKVNASRCLDNPWLNLYNQTTGKGPPASKSSGLPVPQNTPPREGKKPLQTPKPSIHG